MEKYRAIQDHFDKIALLWNWASNNQFYLHVKFDLIFEI